MSFTTSALLLAWVAIALLAFTVAGLIRHVLMMRAGYVRPSSDVGPQRGIAAPRFDTAEPDFRRDTLLLFLNDGCAACNDVAAAVRAVVGSVGFDALAIFPRQSGPLKTNGIPKLEHEAAAFERYRIPAVPFGVLVDSDGVVTDAGAVGSIPALKRFVTAARKEEG
jgi:hypothetical protein